MNKCFSFKCASLNTARSTRTIVPISVSWKSGFSWPVNEWAAVSSDWAQRLKRLFNIDIEVCDRCVGSVKVIACIESKDVIDSILAHLRGKEQDLPSLP